MSDNSSIVSHPPKSSHSTSPSHSPVVRTIVRTLKKGFRRYHQLLVTSPKSLDFKPFRASILLDSRQKNYRLHMARHSHLDTHFSCLFALLRSGTYPRFACSHFWLWEHIYWFLRSWEHVDKPLRKESKMVQTKKQHCAFR